MSLSECSSVKEAEFAYHTRLVVYKFLGLVPTHGINQNESGLADESVGDNPRNVPWELSSLPQVSLIDKLRDSEEHFAKNQCVCDELKRKIKRFSSESPKNESQKTSRTIVNSNQKSYMEVLPKNLLHEIKQKGKLRMDIGDDNLQQMTVIQKQSKVKVFIDHGNNESSLNKNVEVVGGGPLPSVARNQEDDFSELMDSDYFLMKDNSQNASIFSAQKLVRQMSSRSGSSKRLSTYVDVSEVDDETLKSFRTLPRSTIPLKREISVAVYQLESDYNFQLQSFRHQVVAAPPVGFVRPPSEADSPILDESIVCQVADRLRALSDRLHGEYVEQDIEDVVDHLVNQFYAQEEFFQERFRLAMRKFLGDVASGWTKVALLLSVGQRILLRLFESGLTQVSNIGELVATLIHELTGEFILSNGGWSGINEFVPVENPLDLDSSEFLNSIFSETEDVGDLEIVRENKMAESIDFESRKPPEEDKFEPAKVNGNATREGTVDSVEVISDSGIQSNSHDLFSTPTEESVETGVESTDDGFPENSRTLGEKKDEGTKVENKLSGGTDSIPGSSTEVVETDLENSVDPELSALGLISKYLGFLNRESIVKLSILIGGSFLFWKFVFKKNK